MLIPMTEIQKSALLEAGNIGSGHVLAIIKTEPKIIKVAHSMAENSARIA